MRGKLSVQYQDSNVELGIQTSEKCKIYILKAENKEQSKNQTWMIHRENKFSKWKHSSLLNQYNNPIDTNHFLSHEQEENINKLQK